MTSKLDLEAIAQEVDDDSEAIEAVKRKWGPAAYLERSTLGIAPDAAGNHPFSYNRTRFARGKEGNDAWERRMHDPERRAAAEAQCRATAERYGLD